VAGLCENGNETSGSVKYGELLAGWLAGEMLASQERLCSKASVSYLVSQLVNQSETFSYLVSQSLMHSLCQTVRQTASKPESRSVT
jgi:hypothetical protein